jgi:hypothetical protein
MIAFQMYEQAELPTPCETQEVCGLIIAMWSSMKGVKSRLIGARVDGASCDITTQLHYLRSSTLGLRSHLFSWEFTMSVIGLRCSNRAEMF